MAEIISKVGEELVGSGSLCFHTQGLMDKANSYLDEVKGFRTLYWVLVAIAILTNILIWYGLVQHLRWYREYKIQKYLVRIMLIIPTSVILFIIGYHYYNVNVYLNLIRSLGIGWGVWDLYKLIIVATAEDSDEFELKLSSHDLTLPILNINLNLINLHSHLKSFHRAILQFSIIYPSIMIIEAILVGMGQTCPSDLNPRQPLIYLELMVILSALVAIYSLTTLYRFGRIHIQYPITSSLCYVLMFLLFSPILISMIVDIMANHGMISHTLHFGSQIIGVKSKSFVNLIMLMIITLVLLTFKTYRHFTTKRLPVGFTMGLKFTFNLIKLPSNRIGSDDDLTWKSDPKFRVDYFNTGLDRGTATIDSSYGAKGDLVSQVNSNELREGGKSKPVSSRGSPDLTLIAPAHTRPAGHATVDIDPSHPTTTSSRYATTTTNFTNHHLKTTDDSRLPSDSSTSDVPTMGSLSIPSEWDYHPDSYSSRLATISERGSEEERGTRPSSRVMTDSYFTAPSPAVTLTSKNSVKGSYPTSLRTISKTSSPSRIPVRLTSSPSSSSRTSLPLAPTRLPSSSSLLPHPPRFCAYRATTPATTAPPSEECSLPPLTTPRLTPLRQEPPLIAISPQPQVAVAYTTSYGAKRYQPSSHSP